MTCELNLKVTDPAAIERVALGDITLMKDIIKLFLKQTPGELDKIKTAISQKDNQRIKAVAHKLKSSASLVGVKRMHSALKELEIAAVSDFEQDNIIRVFNDLTEVHDLAAYELKRLLLKL